VGAAVNHRLLQACETEIRIVRALRPVCERRIEELGVERAGEVLDLAGPGVRALLARVSWDLPLAVRVAEAVGVDIDEVFAVRVEDAGVPAQVADPAA
jgi:hypothetical protein